MNDFQMDTHAANRDFLMTRSVIVYNSSSSSSSSSSSNPKEEYDDQHNIESSSCSSNSHLDQNPHSPASSKVGLEEQATINYSPRSTDETPLVESPNPNAPPTDANNSMSASIVSINEPAIIILDQIRTYGILSIYYITLLN